MKRSMKYGNNFWHGYSYKVKRDVRFFSDLEYENWLLVETNPHIVNFCEQPFEIQFFYNGKLRSSIFDMWIKYDDGQEEFREVKYQSHLLKGHPKFEDTLKQITGQREWCKSNGFNHRVETDVQIRGNALLVDNSRILISYVRMVQPKHNDLLSEILLSIDTASYSIQDLCNLHKKHPMIDVQISILLGIYKGDIIAPVKEKQINQLMRVCSYATKP